MERIKLICLALLQIFHLSSICVGQYSRCNKINDNFGVIYFNEYVTPNYYYTPSPYENPIKCWNIGVPSGSYARINLLQFDGRSCSYTYLKVKINVTGENFKLCQNDTGLSNDALLHDVIIELHQESRSYGYISFELQYHIESLICVQENHFRCSNDSCISEDQVCDGVKDCKNGADEFDCVPGMNKIKGMDAVRRKSITWLKKQISSSSGWGENTHRAITALYLSGNASFRGDNIEEELFAKQLELETSVALLRNSSDPLPMTDLSMFINALTVTCHNPRQFYGYDLLQILSERVTVSKLVSPGVYLTLCNANWIFPHSHIRKLFEDLHKHSKYPFHLDVQAMTIMALACVKNKTKGFDNIENATEIYDAAIQQIIDGQLSDGSFGNIHTTAHVAQALLSSGQINNKLWKVNSTLEFLVKQLNSSSDFLSPYLILPIFSGKSLGDIAIVNCSSHRKHDEDDEVSNILNKLGGKMHVQYSIYIGNKMDIVYTMFLNVPENSSAYDVMRVAQVADPKYKFMHYNQDDHVYVYSIAGFTNDPEAGKFWLLYSDNNNKNDTVKHHNKSPDKFIIGKGEHLIMWYKSLYI